MFLFFVLMFIVLIVGWRHVRCKTKLNLPPLYPGGWPILGHTSLLGFGTGDTKYLWNLAHEISQEVTENGGVMRATIGFSDYILITDPEDMVTAANACLEKAFCYDFGKCWLGNGLLTATGNATIWKRHRKLLNPSFNQQILDSFIEIFNEQARILVTELESEVNKGYFHHFPYMNRMALETIYQTAIGINSDDDKKLDKKAFIDAEQEMLNIIAQRFQRFWLHSDFIYRFTGLKKRQDECIKVISNTYNRVMEIKKSVAIKEKDQYTGKKCRPFMDLLLDLSADGSLTNKEVWEEVNTIIVAGHDTSATTLVIILVLLGSHPEVQEKMFQELEEMIGDSTRDIGKNDLTKLVYLEAVIKEALRLYPLGVAILRYAREDVQLKNYIIPARSNCVILMCGLHRHPVWGEDVDKFRPERWLEHASDKPNVYAGFGIGKRNCIGRGFAMMLLKTTLAHVLRRYRITADISKLQLKVDVMLKPASGDVISIEERTHF